MKSKYSLFALVIVFSLLSCSKDDTTPPTLSQEQVLISGIWKIDEIRFLQSNIFFYYKRGNTSGNTSNFDTESIKFNSDYTGTYIAGGITYAVNWSFTEATKTKITFTIAYPTPLVVNWENIIYTETSIQYTEYYNRTGNLSLGVATRKL